MENPTPPLPGPPPKKPRNRNLTAAGRAANDEFYTRRRDIEEEMAQHDFSKLAVYCNCDADTSEFPKYFVGRARRVMATGFHPETGEARSFDTEGGGWGPNRWGGGYRENASLLEQADVVVTNPPFSKFRDYMQMLLDWGGRFIVLGNSHAITTKRIWEAAQQGLVWHGSKTRNGNTEFDMPGGEVRRVGVRWYTNFGAPRAGTPIPLTERYDPAANPRYDNCDAADVAKTRLIPRDYAGVMGVPVSYLDRHCPAQFEIVGLVNTPVLKGRNLFKRVLIRNRAPETHGVPPRPSPRIPLNLPPMPKMPELPELPGMPAPEMTPPPLP